MAYDVKFVKGLQAGYDALATKDNGTLYFITDTPAIYLGSTKYTSVSELTAAVSRIGANETAIGNLENALSGFTLTTEGCVKAAIDAVADDLGDLSDLSTTEKGTVVGAINEVKGAIDSLTTDSAVTVWDGGTASTGASKTYRIYQGDDGTHAAGNLVGTIDIPKDMVIESGKLVTVTEQSGHFIDSDNDNCDEFVSAAGTYIKMVIANNTEDKIYINVQGLIDIYTAEQNATQVQLAVSNTGVLSATIVAGSIGTTELANGAVTYDKVSSGVQASLDKADSALQEHQTVTLESGTNDGTVKLTVGSTVTDNIDVTGLGSAAFEDATAFDPAGTAQAAVEALDGSATIASVSSNVVTIKSGITEVDGVVSNNSGNDVVLEEVAITGAAADVSIADSGNKFTADNVEAALQEVKGIADANASAISGMDADIDASASSSDPNAVSVMSGITEVDGVITSVDSVSVDAAGSATQAEANAKAYVDTALTWGSFS